jgi:hypothetical protein
MSGGICSLLLFRLIIPPRSCCPRSGSGLPDRPRGGQFIVIHALSVSSSTWPTNLLSSSSSASCPSLWPSSPSHSPPSRSAVHRHPHALPVSSSTWPTNLRSSPPSSSPSWGYRHSCWLPPHPPCLRCPTPTPCPSSVCSAKREARRRTRNLVINNKPRAV